MIRIFLYIFITYLLENKFKLLLPYESQNIIMNFDNFL